MSCVTCQMAHFACDHSPCTLHLSPELILAIRSLIRGLPKKKRIQGGDNNRWTLQLLDWISLGANSGKIHMEYLGSLKWLFLSPFTCLQQHFCIMLFNIQFYNWIQDCNVNCIFRSLTPAVTVGSRKLFTFATSQIWGTNSISLLP